MTHRYETGVPHGYIPEGDKYANDVKMTLTVKSLLHDDSEYGDKIDKTGKHYGGPFKLEASPNMRVYELRKLIKEKCGIAPGLQVHLVYYQKSAVYIYFPLMYML